MISTGNQDNQMISTGEDNYQLFSTGEDNNQDNYNIFYKDDSAFIIPENKNKAIKRLNKMENIAVIGITGSFGKTSTKMILNDILSVKYKGFCTVLIVFR